jgi:hypothetical protein
LAVCVVTTLVVLGGGGTLAAGASDPTPPTSVLPAATSGAAWLSAELAAGGNQLSNGVGVDWGLTADAALALIAINGPTDPEAAATVTNLLAHVADYTTYDTSDPPFPGYQLAGPTAKSLLVAEVAGQGSDPAAVSLESVLRTLLDASGRVTDVAPDTVDTSNGFSQADAILALARTTGGVPASAVTYLLAQQCPSGGFRLNYSGAGCGDDAQADTDATAIAVQALMTVGRSSSVATALSRAVGWLESIQNPTTGSFSGTGPTAAPNTNSTGLIAQALRAAGETAQADKAAGWISTLQLAPPAPSAGAIAYNPDGFAAASGGIPAPKLDEWHRATTQAVLAIGVAPLGSIGAGGAPLPDPVSPTAPTSTTTTTSSTTTTTAGSGSTTTTTVAGSVTTTTTGPTSSSTVPTSVLGASTQKVNFASALGASRSSSSSKSSASSASAGSGTTGPLAQTGGTVSPLLALGLIAFFIGLATVFAVRFGDWTA